jgi:RHS repeat-associated protein
LRVKKTPPSGAATVYIFSGSQVIAEYAVSGSSSTLSKEYIYTGGQMVASISGSATSYYHQDHLSNRLVTDSSGTVTEQTGTFPYGESWYTASGEKLVFTTYERDAESGNDYAMARTYSSRLGRFTAVDPLNGDISDPQSLNRYVYALDDPINGADPTGMFDGNLTGMSGVGYYIDGMPVSAEYFYDQLVAGALQDANGNSLVLNGNMISAIKWEENYASIRVRIGEFKGSIWTDAWFLFYLGSFQAFDYYTPTVNTMWSFGQGVLGATSQTLGSLVEGSDCLGNAIGSEIPFGETLGLTNGKMHGGLIDKADDALAYVGYLAIAGKHSERISRVLNLIELPNIAEKVAQYGPKVGAVAERLGPLGAAATGLDVALKTRNCYKAGN